MQKKYADFSKLWTGQPVDDENDASPVKEEQFDYSNIDSVTLFEGTHPSVMKELVASENWNNNINTKDKNFNNIQHRVLSFLWRKVGWLPFEYCSYKRM